MLVFDACPRSPIRSPIKNVGDRRRGQALIGEPGILVSQIGPYAWKNKRKRRWIPAYAGMTHLSIVGHARINPPCRRVACTPRDEKGDHAPSLSSPTRSGIQGFCFFHPPHPAPFDFPPPSVLSPLTLPSATLRTGVATAKSKNAQDRLSLRGRGLYRTIFMPMIDSGHC